jgi:hypothetical protein
MVSCARATRGLGRPSLDTRSGRPSSPPSREQVEVRWSLDAGSGESGCVTQAWNGGRCGEKRLPVPYVLRLSRLSKLYLSGIWLGWLYGCFVRSSATLRNSRYVNYST